MKFQVFAKLELEADSVDELLPQLQLLNYGQRDKNIDTFTSTYVIPETDDAIASALALFGKASVVRIRKTGDQ